ncbi:hypothetical protein G9A89_008888 [Geosiphon pyriformis]|nr:hypothetical protein G9A89_008888 [Geosiphon pyriformis]
MASRFATSRFMGLLTTPSRSCCSRRGFSAQVPAGKVNPLLAEQEAIEEHARHAAQLWRKISLYVAGPGILLTAWNAYRIASEHAAHHHEEETPPYPYLRLRTKMHYE